MKPISFSCTRSINLPAAEISAQIADMEKWKEFTGHGLLPGIKDARYENKTPDMVGSIISVSNMDGSSHTEEIYTWEPESAIGIRLNASKL